MQVSVFSAKCPYEIGDKVIICNSQSMGKTENLLDDVKTITDIACIHYLKNGTVEFRYELDGNGIYAPIQTK